MTENYPSGFLVTLYGTAHCQKTLYYRNVLDERRVAYRFADMLLLTQRQRKQSFIDTFNSSINLNFNYKEMVEAINNKR